jgi:uncharacterized protein YifE (UPF0438 family)
MTVSEFCTDKIFRDPINFPYGFVRSGEFTIEQARLLERCGEVYQALDAGTRQPQGDQEREFVAFCRGERDANSLHERVWKRYQDKVKRAGMIFTLAKGNASMRGTYLVD